MNDLTLEQRALLFALDELYLNQHYLNQYYNSDPVAKRYRRDLVAVLDQPKADLTALKRCMRQGTAKKPKQLPVSSFSDMVNHGVNPKKILDRNPFLGSGFQTKSLLGYCIEKQNYDLRQVLPQFIADPNGLGPRNYGLDYVTQKGFKDVFSSNELIFYHLLSEQLGNQPQVAEEIAAFVAEYESQLSSNAEHSIASLRSFRQYNLPIYNAIKDIDFCKGVRDHLDHEQLGIRFNLAGRLVYRLFTRADQYYVTMLAAFTPDQLKQECDKVMEKLTARAKIDA